MNYLDTAAHTMIVAFDQCSQHLKYCFPHVFHLGCRNTRIFKDFIAAISNKTVNKSDNQGVY